VRERGRRELTRPALLAAQSGVIIELCFESVSCRIERGRISVGRSRMEEGRKAKKKERGTNGTQRVVVSMLGDVLMRRDEKRKGLAATGG